ncbi:MAG: 3-dehydroquinate synthase II [Candidatus Bathyarchaeia archaeon]
MSKELWVKLKGERRDLREFIDRVKEFVDFFLISDWKLVSEDKPPGVKIVSKTGGDLKLVDSVYEASQETCLTVEVSSREDEEKILEGSNRGCRYIIVKCLNWKIIPLENIVAKLHGKTKIIAEASSLEEADTLTNILEIGVDGVLIEAAKPEDVRRLREAVSRSVNRLELKSVKVVSIKPVKLGARVCLDTCDLLSEGEGVLVGCQSSGLFLVEAEVHGNPYVEARPFRVNAGPPALYILVPGGKTRYLSELKAGDTLLAVKRDGSFREVELCRVKIEWRPMKLVEVEYASTTYKTVVQDAETVRFVASDGSKSVAELKIGDEVLLHMQEGGRHFGTLVKSEKIIER